MAFLFDVVPERAVEEERFTPHPHMMPVLRHRGGVGGGILPGDLGDELGVVSYQNMDNDIPRGRAPPPSSPDSGSSRMASAFVGHKALRHANLHGLRGLRLD